MKKFSFTDRTQVKLSSREITPEGFLKAKAAYTCVGIQQYLGEELGLTPGKVYNVFRPPETVFHPKTAESIQLKAVTNNHPSVDVTPGNYKALSIGHVGDSVGPLDGERLGGYTLITDSNAIEDIEGGKDQVSLGYDCMIVDEAGVWNGKSYDLRFDGPMICNHLAYVDAGRCGENVKFLDGGLPMKKVAILKAFKDAGVDAAHFEDAFKDKKDDDEVTADEIVSVLKNSSNEAPSVAEQVKAALEDADMPSMKDMPEGMMEMMAKMMMYMMGMMGDGMMGKDAYGMKRPMDAAPGGDPGTALIEDADIEAKVEARATLLSDAKSMLPKDFEVKGKSNREIMIAAIGDSAKLEGKSDDYVQAVYDGIVSDRQEAAKQMQDAGVTVSATVKPMSAIDMRRQKKGSK